jgi:hypothetical protein
MGVEIAACYSIVIAVAFKSLGLDFFEEKQNKSMFFLQQDKYLMSLQAS